MKEVFVMNKEMHMGPINRTLRAGDVVTWQADTGVMTINNNVLPDDGRHKGSHEGFVEVARILAKQAATDPENAWAEIRSMETPGESMEIRTDTLAVFPILGCLKAAEDWIGGQQTWTPTSPRQTEFLEHFIEHIEQVDALGSNLVRIADSSPETINQFLEDHGFPDLKLTVQPSVNGFCVASVLDVLCEWLKKGDATDIKNHKGSFPGVRLKEGVAAYHDKSVHPFPVVKIRTKSGDILCMSICGPLSSDDYAMHWKVEALRKIDKPLAVEGVMFPMVKYDNMMDISFLKGLQTSPGNNHWYVAEAVQQTRFRMNLEGARAESAAAMQFFKCAVREKSPWVVIDRPFVLWIERKGIALPVFEGVFAEDVWQNPGGLE